jgi:hypothetical protein
MYKVSYCEIVSVFIHHYGDFEVLKSPLEPLVIRVCSLTCSCSSSFIPEEDKHIDLTMQHHIAMNIRNSS